MKDNIFADSNVALYVFDKKTPKQTKALEIIELKPIITSQVLIESMNVCIRKFNLSKNTAYTNSIYLLKCCNFYSIQPSTFVTAFSLSEKYGYSHLDSLIIASALESDCTILYSEDMQHKQKIEGKLQIINPFK